MTFDVQCYTLAVVVAKLASQMQCRITSIDKFNETNTHL